MGAGMMFLDWTNRTKLMVLFQKRDIRRLPQKSFSDWVDLHKLVTGSGPLEKEKVGTFFFSVLRKNSLRPGWTLIAVNSLLPVITWTFSTYKSINEYCRLNTYSQDMHQLLNLECPFHSAKFLNPSIKINGEVDGLKLVADSLSKVLISISIFWSIRVLSLMKPF